MNRNITPYGSLMAASDRCRLTGTTPTIIWMTGLSGAGKSTVSALAEKMLTEEGFVCTMLDGDTVRNGLCADLGFSPEDRAENLRRIAESAAIAAQIGAVVLVGTISPLQENRDRARTICGSKADFAEVYVKASLEECEKRDPKGLYKKAAAGEIKNFTGVSAPYEVPENPDLVLDTAIDDAETCAEKLCAFVKARQLDLARVVEVCAKASLAAGVDIMGIYSRDFEVEIKSDNSPVTAADKASEKVIREILSREFPACGILSEETADEEDAYGVPKRLHCRRCFVVDPLDGTKEFVNKNGEFTVNIALSFNHRVVAGVIYIPVKHTLYCAAEGLGAYRYDGVAPSKEGVDFSFPGKGEKLTADSRTDHLRVLASRSFPDAQTDAMIEKNKDRIESVLNRGSSIKGCMIAEGGADVHYRFGPYTKDWDSAAMMCICREAGAVFTDGKGRMLLSNRTDSVNRDGFIILNRSESALPL